MADYDRIREYERNYREGHRNGYNDARLGLSLMVARAGNPSLPGYGEGYRAGAAAGREAANG